jgi:hypothetical protein
MTNKPKPHLFFTDPLKALYMMKEFGVKFDIRGIDNFVAYMKNPVDGARINVATKSQKIFKFKKSDLVKYGFGSVDFYNQISQKNSVYEIIYRDNKQFFMPEVEND